ncbi:MAG: DegV family protein [Bacillota bacterium]|nr:DegV family protein [Bacillota bacterium]
MTRVAIVTDSTADIPKALQQKYNVEVVPLNVIFGDENLKDGVDITSKGFFEMLPKSTVHPSTSQPSPGDFLTVYTEAIKNYDQIISIHISSLLSGTYQSAVLASQMLEEAKITVIDSRTTSLGLGLAVIAAAEARNAGKSHGEIVAAAKHVCDKQILMLSVETLEWLQRNGRIGKASALLGSLLNVHPILKIEEGIITPHAKIRGKMTKVLQSLVESAGEFVPHGSEVVAAIVHGNCPERAEELKVMLKEVYQLEDVIINEIGPVIGVHVGPGAVGVIVVPK